jgi:hypothetical protein
MVDYRTGTDVICTIGGRDGAILLGPSASQARRVNLAD